MADTIKQKIVFAMGTTGTSKATKSFASMAVKVAAVGAAIAVAVKGMSKMYDAAVTLDRQLKALNTDMSLYNAETKGLIDTNDGLAAAIQLQNAGIKASKEEMAALGKAAINMNQQLGGGPDGATTIFNSLVKSVAGAQEKGLMKFGLELSQVSDKAAASKEALEKLVEKFGDIKVEAETAKEKMYAFNNSFGTVMASEFNGILNNLNKTFADSITYISGSTDALNQYEQDIIATNGAISDYMWSIDGMILRNKIWVNSLNGNTEFVAKLNAEYREQVDLLTNIANLERSIANKKQKLSDLGKIDTLRNNFINAKNKRDQKIYGERLQSLVRGKARGDMNSKERAIFDSGILDQKFAGDSSITAPKIQARRAGGGRSRPSAPVDDMTFTEDNLGVVGDVYAGSTVDRRGLFSGGLDSIGDFGTASNAGGAANQAQEQARITAEAQVLAKQNMYQNLLGLERQYLAESNRMNQQSNEQKAQSVEAMASVVGTTFSNMGQAFNEESKSGFNAMKAMTYAGNIVETTLASTAAFRSVMQSLPFPANVIAAPILAGSVAAMGAAAGNKIRKQKYGTSGSVSSTAPKVSFPSGGMGAGSGGGSDTYVFNVNVDGDQVHNSMLKKNDMAKQTGDKHFQTGAA